MTLNYIPFFCFYFVRNDERLKLPIASILELFLSVVNKLFLGAIGPYIRRQIFL